MRTADHLRANAKGAITEPDSQDFYILDTHGSRC